MEYEHEGGKASWHENSSMSMTKLIYFLEHLDSLQHKWRRYAKFLPWILTFVFSLWTKVYNYVTIYSARERDIKVTLYPFAT